MVEINAVGWEEKYIVTDDSEPSLDSPDSLNSPNSPLLSPLSAHKSSVDSDDGWNPDLSAEAAEAAEAAENLDGKEKPGQFDKKLEFDKMQADFDGKLAAFEGKLAQFDGKLVSPSRKLDFTTKSVDGLESGEAKRRLISSPATPLGQTLLPSSSPLLAGNLRFCAKVHRFNKLQSLIPRSIISIHGVLRWEYLRTSNRNKLVTNLIHSLDFNPRNYSVRERLQHCDLWVAFLSLNLEGKNALGRPFCLWRRVYEKLEGLFWCLKLGWIISTQLWWQAICHNEECKPTKLCELCLFKFRDLYESAFKQDLISRRMQRNRDRFRI